MLLKINAAANVRSRAVSKHFFSGLLSHPYLSTANLIGAAVFLSLGKYFLGASGVLGAIVLMVATVIFWGQCQRLPRPWRYGVQFSIVIGITALIAVWMNVTAGPAQAQFFNGAETFFKDSFTKGGPGLSDAIALVFNALRALYILYLAVSLVGVINAVRQDEDWQTVARTPALIVVCVTIADVLVGLITGIT